MWRKYRIFALLIGLGAPLAACDKCGGFQELRSPIPPKVCVGETAR